MISIGVDPDTKHTAVAVLYDDPWRLVDAFTVDHPRPEIKGWPAIDSMINQIVQDTHNRLKVDTDVYHRWLNNEPVYCWIEGQQIYTGGKKATRNPDPIIRLAYLSGAISAAFKEVMPCVFTEIVKPAVWKGQLPKDVCQARAYTKLGIDYRRRSGYCVPTIEHFSTVPVARWKHLGDAVALAQWGTKEPETR